MSTAMASWNFSRKRTSSMQVSRGLPHMLTSNQRGRGNEPVVVLGRIRLSVAVNMLLAFLRQSEGEISSAGCAAPPRLASGREDHHVLPTTQLVSNRRCISAEGKRRFPK